MHKGERTLINTQEANNNKVSKFFNIPYVRGFSDRFRRVTRDIDATLSFSGLNNLRSIIRVHKDSLQSLSHMNVVYKIGCSNCEYAVNILRCILYGTNVQAP